MRSHGRGTSCLLFRSGQEGSVLCISGKNREHMGVVLESPSKPLGCKKPENRAGKQMMQVLQKQGGFQLVGAVRFS